MSAWHRRPPKPSGSKEEGELEVRDLLTRKETEWQQQLAKLEQRYDADRAVFDRERQFNELQEYRRDRIEQESEFILPELRDLITGDNPAAIDASIEVMKARTEQIFANMQAANTSPHPTARSGPDFTASRADGTTAVVRIVDAR